jgi:hypothetical protein
VLKVHRRAEGIRFGARKAAIQDPFKKPLKVAACRVAGGWGAAIAGWNEFESLGLGDTHAAGKHAKALGALLDFNDGSNDITIFTPKLKEAPPVGFNHGITREAHVEENPAIFKKSSRGMSNEVFLEDFS